MNFTAETKHRACGVDELEPMKCVVVPLPRVHDYIPREALVLRTGSGEIVGYRNECRHLPIPIDGMTRRFFTPDGKRLLCALHGAEYNLDDGVCVRGPCKGKALERLRVEIEANDVFVVDVMPATPL